MNYISITELNELGIYNINFNPAVIDAIRARFCREDAESIINDIREIISNISTQYIGKENRLGLVNSLKCRIESEIKNFLQQYYNFYIDSEIP